MKPTLLDTTLGITSMGIMMSISIYFGILGLHATDPSLSCLLYGSASVLLMLTFFLGGILKYFES